MFADKNAEKEYRVRNVSTGKIPKNFHQTKICVNTTTSFADVVVFVVGSSSGPFAINRLAPRRYKIGFLYESERTMFLMKSMSITK